MVSEAFVASNILYPFFLLISVECFHDFIYVRTAYSNLYSFLYLRYIKSQKL